MLEEIKAKIREGKIDEAMAIAMSEALKLEIVTSLSDSEIGKSSNSVYLRTFIDLLNNRIDYQISEDMLNNSAYNQIKEIHFEQVQQGNERIVKNLENLQKMFSVLKNTLSDLPEN